MAGACAGVVSDGCLRDALEYSACRSPAVSLSETPACASKNPELSREVRSPERRAAAAAPALEHALVLKALRFPQENATIAIAFRLRHIALCQEPQRRKIAGSKKGARTRSIGSAGDLTFPSASGARFAKITAGTAPRGNISRTTMRARARIAGAKTASAESATAIR